MKRTITIILIAVFVSSTFFANLVHAQEIQAPEIHTDHLTGSNVVTNSGGTQEELMDYFPYGNIRLDHKTGSFDEQRKFTGQEYDVDTGLYNYGARYYNPAIGRLNEGHLCKTISIGLGLGTHGF